MVSASPRKVRLLGRMPIRPMKTPSGRSSLSLRRLSMSLSTITFRKSHLQLFSLALHTDTAFSPTPTFG